MPTEFIQRKMQKTLIFSLYVYFTKQQKKPHRIIEYFGLKGTLKILSFQLPCHGQGHAH